MHNSWKATIMMSTRAHAFVLVISVRKKRMLFIQIAYALRQIGDQLLP